MTDSVVNFRVERAPSLRELIYHNLRDEIINGRLPPGVRLVETRLGAAVGASRTPVREALRSLEREGLIERAPGTGYQVRIMRWDELKEICEIRTVNEILAAQWAAKRHDDTELDRLEANMTASDAAVTENNVERCLELDFEFHALLTHASGSDRLFELCGNLGRQMALIRSMIYRDPSLARSSLAGHRRVLECVKGGEAQEIADAVRAHLVAAIRAVEQLRSSETLTEGSIESSVWNTYFKGIPGKDGQLLD